MRYKNFLIAILSFLYSNVIAQSYDVLIKNGRIMDGTGNSWYYGDVGVKNGKITAIGKLNQATASRTIDAAGLVVAPGFIDVHTHIEGDEMVTPTGDNFIHDGVTTVVTGNCGGSSADIAKYFARLDSVKTSLNIATLIGHNTVRRAVMGDAQRNPTPAELAHMEH